MKKIVPISFIFLFLGNNSSLGWAPPPAANPPPPPEKKQIELQKSSILWKNTLFSAQLGRKLLGELLYLSMNFKVLSEERKLTVLFNLGAAGRFISAYLYYLEPLKKKFPSRKVLINVIDSQKKFVKTLKKFEKLLESTKSSPAELAQKIPPVFFVRPGSVAQFDKEGRELLLEASAAFARGIDLITYYLIKEYSRSVEKWASTERELLKRSISALNEDLKGFRKELKMVIKFFPNEGWARASLFHSALAMVSLKYLYRSLSFPAKKSRYLKKFNKYFQALTISVSRINPSLKTFWK